jgi:hypothetical protein
VAGVAHCFDNNSIQQPALLPPFRLLLKFWQAVSMTPSLVSNSTKAVATAWECDGEAYCVQAKFQHVMMKKHNVARRWMCAFTTNGRYDLSGKHYKHSDKSEAFSCQV